MEEFTETFVLEFFFPFFVVMITAPFLAREPYNAAAAAPFKIVIVSTSSGLISPARLPKSTLFPIVPPAEVELLIGNPSTTNKGWLSPSNELAPRIIIFAEPPKVPDAEFTLTPETLPARELITLVSRALIKSSPFTVAVE